LVQVATIQELREANAILNHAKETSHIGIYFSPDGPEWNDAVVCTISDASFGNESEIIKGEKEGDRSQQGYIIVLAPPDILNAETAVVHPIVWSSTTIKRVCRATLMAEAFSLTNGTESGARIRAAIVDARGKLDHRNWELSASENMSHVWLTDCDSLYEHLISPSTKQVANKRLAIDLKALRQSVWERAGERTDVVDSTSGDYPRWIDTSTMIADPLTKTMAATRLEETLTTGLLDLRPTEESLLIKAKNRASRKKTKEEKQSNVVNRGSRDGDHNQLEITDVTSSCSDPRVGTAYCAISSTPELEMPRVTGVRNCSSVAYSALRALGSRRT